MQDSVTVRDDFKLDAQRLTRIPIGVLNGHLQHHLCQTDVQPQWSLVSRFIGETPSKKSYNFPLTERIHPGGCSAAQGQIWPTISRHLQSRCDAAKIISANVRASTYTVDQAIRDVLQDCRECGARYGHTTGTAKLRLPLI